VLPFAISSLNVRRSGERGANLKMEVGPKSWSPLSPSYECEFSYDAGVFFFIETEGDEIMKSDAHMEKSCGGNNAIDVVFLWFRLCEQRLRLRGCR
jgi:hypothetical protein